MFDPEPDEKAQKIESPLPYLAMTLPRRRSAMKRGKHVISYPLLTEYLPSLGLYASAIKRCCAAPAPAS